MTNSLTFPILKVLADGRFHSGEALAQHFDVTRATIWNALQDAEALGIEIFSVRGRGYKLPEPIVMLDKQAILSSIGEQRAWFNVEVHDHLESTNTYLMKKAASGAAHATCIVASLQTKGRGRRGRAWQAGLGNSLTFSLLWRFQSGAAALSGLSLAIGVALIRALNEIGIQAAQLKWPNDVLVNYQKLAGILIELQGDMDGPSAAVIGIGINLKLPEHLKRHIDQAATDMKTLTGQDIDPNLILGVLLKHLGDVLKDFEKDGFEILREEWLHYHAYQDKPVRLLMPDGRELQGQVNGVGLDGILLVQTAQGEQRFSAGEISLRGSIA
ncbi:biotin--[acetyl-CoA-carboxylase] ligase [Methylovorus sp. MM2]|uniref:biotin--[acetyl-CoA-carboxylase] ligase n=1 Tax=Methylovorus sp. MM2 TaxID=1848038 RepID=UPI0007E0DD27|nr:biotin--[acetyl-CoA-carboxylase] ligase [Methylovorus sp. MM2]OAM51164.1 biotin--[acetyl-CoA-carboxylase] ligase [Methylovorus sp. MM2]